MVTIGDSRRGSLNYRYDPVGRLLEANSRLGRETFAFDPAGNIADPPPANEPLRHPAGKLPDNLLKNYAGTSYRYDERGNMTERVRNGWRNRLRMGRLQPHDRGDRPQRHHHHLQL
ncbi:YD repeat-containing protein [Variovorax sp. 1140]|uniref:hypothetical protein n=1 Tax=Variovorax atrisoli TaxID=3394203 RepID=UPI003396D8A7